MDKHSPKPLVEEHHHIQGLIQAQNKRTEDRNYHREKEKNKAEREDLIKDSKGMVLTDFFCSRCREDFKATAVRQVEEDWANPTQRIAFYKTKCFKGHWCVRLITDKWRDAYWVKSKRVRADRAKFHNDLIQPHEENYNLLYGK